jgi:hypothetical protein
MLFETTITFASCYPHMRSERNVHRRFLGDAHFSDVMVQRNICLSHSKHEISPAVAWSEFTAAIQ